MRTLSAFLGLKLALEGSAVAQPLTAFYPEDTSPLAGGTRSLEVVREDEPLFSAASSLSPKRGAARRGAHLPVLAAKLGPGCAGRWFVVGPLAFICEEGTRPSAVPPISLDAPAQASFQGLPYNYYFVGRDGSFGYRALLTAEDGVPEAQLQPGFGVAIERIQGKPNGDPFGLTTRGFWVPMRDLSAVAPVLFQGSSWSSDLAWTRSDAAPLFSEPGKRRPGATLARLTQVRVLQSVGRAGQLYARVSADDWLRERDLARPKQQPPPEEVGATERWLDIDLQRQTAVAYVGSQPVFATLVSSGRGPTGSESATPEGVFRIWVKLRTSDMDNLESSEQRRSYAIEAVPWVAFFHLGYGLHGTFWHQRFGEVRSHGCVNLAPVDAERLFYWSSPRLLPGWSAVFPTPNEPGTLVRIRKSDAATHPPERATATQRPSRTQTLP